MRDRVAVAVVGSGNGALAVAFDFASHGHDVRLVDSAHFPDQVAAVAVAGGIHATGEIEGFAAVTYAGQDAETAVAGAGLVVLVGPAYSTEHQAALVAPYLVPGQAVLVCPASCAGAITAKRALGLALDDETITVGETSTLPYAVRIVGPARITVFHKLGGGVLVAGLPRSGTGRLLSLVQDVYPGAEAAQSVFQTTLQNGNPVIHPAVTLLNAGLIERTGGGFLFYEEGITEAVGRVIEAADLERLAIAAALGVSVLSEPDLGVVQGYMREASYSTGYSTAPGFLGIGAQDRLDHRYLTEDVGYSLVFLTDLARRTGVATPTMDALITLASVVLAQDLRGQGARTLTTLGLDGLSAQELAAL
ncbi:Opine dehydrogenase [Nocardioides aquaticus]|uniref:Opine dehydrogenase n=1 Tax=Nocardioides aquaticus TaxID=160826 RepID=A0ABX8EIR7_9ACTN|nr:NAD/NADP octopine/nopaline dehydrogenase family protein [Nocardioides aquaticus]QVT79790.1 Opine dehydrogenase [Nocardioides aquaticus]